MPIETRIRQLEIRIDQEETEEVRIIIYPPGDQPPTDPNSRVQILIPDNSRGTIRPAAIGVSGH